MCMYKPVRGEVLLSLLSEMGEAQLRQDDWAV